MTRLLASALCWDSALSQMCFLKSENVHLEKLPGETQTFRAGEPRRCFAGVGTPRSQRPRPSLIRGREAPSRAGGRGAAPGASVPLPVAEVALDAPPCGRPRRVCGCTLLGRALLTGSSFLRRRWLVVPLVMGTQWSSRPRTWPLGCVLRQEGRSLGADSMVHYGGSQDFFFPEEGSKNSQK